MLVAEPFLERETVCRFPLFINAKGTVLSNNPRSIGQVMTGSLTNYFFAKVAQGDMPYRGLERGLACAKGRNRGVAQGDVPWRGLERG